MTETPQQRRSSQPPGRAKGAAAASAAAHHGGREVLLAGLHRGALLGPGVLRLLLLPLVLHLFVFLRRGLLLLRGGAAARRGGAWGWREEGKSGQTVSP